MKYWLKCLGLALVVGLLNYFPIPLPVYEQNILPMLSFGLAFILGIYFPDIDLFTPGLKHRSAVTHSVLLPWLLTMTGYPAVVAGLSMGMAIHILADVFPKVWIGNALVKMPLFGSIGKTLSPFWLTFNCLACLALGLQKISIQGSWVQVAALGFSLVMMLWYMIKKEKSIPPLMAALMIVGLLAWNHYSPDISLFNLKTLTASQ